MALPDRILPLCDLLLGAAYADKQFQDRERKLVRELLAELTEAELTPKIEERIEKFDPSSFELAATAAEFRGDPEADRCRLLLLVSAIHDADEELDLAEDEYLRALAGTLDLSHALTGLALDIEIEEMRGELEKVRKGPPPTPAPRKTESVDVDLDADADAE